MLHFHLALLFKFLLFPIKLADTILYFLNVSTFHAVPLQPGALKPRALMPGASKPARDFTFDLVS